MSMKHQAVGDKPNFWDFQTVSMFHLDTFDTFGTSLFNFLTTVFG